MESLSFVTQSVSQRLQYHSHPFADLVKRYALPPFTHCLRPPVTWLFPRHGHRRELLRGIEELHGVEKDPPKAAPPMAQQDTAERRRVTLMFSDLVGSTALSARMDPATDLTREGRTHRGGRISTHCRDSPRARSWFEHCSKFLLLAREGADASSGGTPPRRWGAKPQRAHYR